MYSSDELFQRSREGYFAIDIESSSNAFYDRDEGN